MRRRAEAMRAGGAESVVSVAGFGVADWMERFARSEEGNPFWGEAREVEQRREGREHEAEDQARRDAHRGRKGPGNRVQRMMELAQRARVA